MKKNSGFIRIILLIIIVLIILGYFGFNVVDIVNLPTVQSNLHWAWNIVLVLWSYISAPVTLIWNYVWGLFQAGLSQ